MTATAFRPRYMRMVMVLTVRLGIERRKGSRKAEIVDRLFADLRERWLRDHPDRDFELLNPATTEVDGNTTAPELSMARRSVMVERMLKMPTLFTSVHRVALSNERLFIENSMDVRNVRDRWMREHAELQAFLKNERRLKYDIVLMALIKDFKSSTNPLKGMFDNVLAGRHANDPKGFVADDDMEQAKLLLKGSSFILLPDV